jgi:glycosyltransferase involved in cell wall biosynthesis
MRVSPSTPVSRHPVPPTPRVLLLDAGRTWRGTQRQLVLLALGLRERGVEPLVVAPPRSPLLDACKRAGIATAVRPMRSSFDLLAVRGLRRLITAWQPTVVHAHCPRTHLLALAALVGRRAAVPLVVTRRRATAPRGPARFGKRVARVIAISDAVAAALHGAGIPDARIVRIYPGVRHPGAVAARDWRTECGWPADVVVAGIVGPLTEPLHREALERLLRRLPARTQARLALVLLGGPSAGAGGIADMPAYRAGFVHDVSAALAGLDLLLHPGGAEGIGTALIEGMALRVPSVAFAAGGVGEIIRDGETGLLVPAGDGDALAAAVAAMVEDPVRRRALGNAGPARADSFGVDAMVDRTLALYRELTRPHAGLGQTG